MERGTFSGYRDQVFSLYNERRYRQALDVVVQVSKKFPGMKELQEEFNKLAEIRGEEKIQMPVRVGKADPAYYQYRRSFNRFSR